MNDSASLPLDPEEEGLLTSRLDFPVVGIGASAGGLQAVEAFLQHLPAEPGMAFVVVLHLSPKHDSLSDKILQRSTKMRVLQVSEPMSIKVDTVYVIRRTDTCR